MIQTKDMLCAFVTVAHGCRSSSMIHTAAAQTAESGIAMRVVSVKNARYGLPLFANFIKQKHKNALKRESRERRNRSISLANTVAKLSRLPNSIAQPVGQGLIQINEESLPPFISDTRGTIPLDDPVLSSKANQSVSSPLSQVAFPNN